MNTVSYVASVCFDECFYKIMKQNLRGFKQHLFNNKKCFRFTLCKIKAGSNLNIAYKHFFARMQHTLKGQKN